MIYIQYFWIMHITNKYARYLHQSFTLASDRQLNKDDHCLICQHAVHKVLFYKAIDR